MGNTQELVGWCKMCGRGHAGQAAFDLGSDGMGTRPASFAQVGRRLGLVLRREGFSARMGVGALGLTRSNLKRFGEIGDRIRRTRAGRHRIFFSILSTVMLGFSDFPNYYVFFHCLKT